MSFVSVLKFVIVAYVVVVLLVVPQPITAVHGVEPMGVTDPSVLLVLLAAPTAVPVLLLVRYLVLLKLVGGASSSSSDVVWIVPVVLIVVLGAVIGVMIIKRKYVSAKAKQFATRYPGVIKCVKDACLCSGPSEQQPPHVAVQPQQQNVLIQPVPMGYPMGPMVYPNGQIYYPPYASMGVMAPQNSGPMPTTPVIPQQERPQSMINLLPHLDNIKYAKS